MWLDLVYLGLLIAAVIKGSSKGIILALFSLVGWIIGLAAALKLSSSVAAYLQTHTGWDARWLPVISFILVFVIVAMLVQWAGKALEGVLKLAMLGWVNKLGGALLYAGMITLAFSVMLFYIDQMQLVPQTTLENSRAYTATAGLAPLVLDGIGSIIPAAKNMFQQLEDFFDKTSNHIPNGEA